MNEEYKNNFMLAGALACKVRAFGKSLIQKGRSCHEVLKAIRAKILEVGGRPAFPPQIALNQVAAHDLPYPGRDFFFTDQVVKLDIGVCFNGAIGDCAVTIDLSGQHQDLIDAAEAALLAAEKSIHVDQPIREIGRIIETTIKSQGYKPILNLSGHGLGYYQIHTEPLIPNYDDHSKGRIRAGMTFAIEPFATDGRGSIVEKGNPMIFSWMGKGNAKSVLAHSLLPRIWAFDGLPFAMHDLLNEDWTVDKLAPALLELCRSKVLFGHAPLVEINGAFVAQAENSVLVDEKGKVWITTR